MFTKSQSVKAGIVQELVVLLSSMGNSAPSSFRIKKHIYTQHARKGTREEESMLLSTCPAHTLRNPISMGF